MQHITGQERQPMAERKRYRRLASRFLGAAVLATTFAQLVFVSSYALGAAPAMATALSWLAGAVPNFVLNRRSWGSTGTEGLRREIIRYGAISIGTALLAGYLTHAAEGWALHAYPSDRLAQIGLVWGTFICTYLAMFVLKFFLIDRLVFTGHPRREQAH